MAIHVCSIVSPHLLENLASNGNNKASWLAEKTLAHTRHIWKHRNEVSNGQSTKFDNIVLQGIVPDQLLEEAVTSDAADQATEDHAQNTLDTNQQARDGGSMAAQAAAADGSIGMHRQVFDMQHFVSKVGKVDQTFSWLPGTLVRSEGEAPVGDNSVNEAYDNCAKVTAFYKEVFQYTFLNDDATPLVSSVHFEETYQNALWIGGSVRQMIYGDGGHDLQNFTACLDIIAHEMTVRIALINVFQ